MSTATLEKKAVHRFVYHVRPCEGADGMKWELHQFRTTLHEQFHTQKEAVAAAHMKCGERPSHIVMHALDGHTYREYDVN
ncbi:hypothetical protein QO003_000319 [Arthrobacter silviterrae]|jgi:hypothetical protein|uniref:DUF2188 domain-containing protein n=1 Tax=Arthrobacter silviterrae TaxID=2026658 RepID=A0ABX0DF35_9MICC|nr:MULTISPECIES: DUF2188 domain-containing protein [Arthrobacter]MCU6479999.1 DUF2188 domain-containing protein [Arthrobacter sp. A2-55]MDQ0276016.1 hypothetical protein [Arthrobacter silviterrae]NGN84351.1 DUF2188 domain-containing protein [Arthrobacter silviterrae]